MSGRVPRTLVVFVATLCAAAGARAQSADVCRSVLTARGVTAQGDDPCHTLAVMIATTSRPVSDAAAEILKPDAVPVSSVFSARDIQSHKTQHASLAGTPAQGEAVPEVVPAGVAAGTIAAVGTDSGHDAIAAISLNPLVLMIGDDATEQLAKYSRFLDLTLFLPVTQGTPPSGTTPGTLRYFGARARVNFTGIGSGSKVWEGARQLILKWMSRAGRNTTVVLDALTAAPSLKDCANALLDNGNAAQIKAACGKPVALEVNKDEAVQLRAELAKVRRAADSKYFGADVRYDHGDPTLGDVANASGDFLFGGLAFGRQISGSSEATSFGVRSRVGIRHAKLKSSQKSEFAVEGGLGFDLSRHVDPQDITASGALEFRYGNAEANLRDEFQSNFTVFRGSIVVPLASANSISINFGLPVTGPISSTFSVNFNWGVLLPGAK